MSTDTPDLFDAPGVPESVAPSTPAGAAPSAASTTRGAAPATASDADIPPPPAPPADPEPEPEDGGTLALDRFAERAYLPFPMNVGKAQ